VVTPVVTLAVSLVVGLLVVGLAGALTVASGSPGWAKSVRVRHTLFGVHDATSTSFSTIGAGSVRLWNAGVRWDQVETSPGSYRWKRLDQLVSAAQAAHAEVTMTVAMTPSFYAARPTDPPRSVAPYRRFVHALMDRYRSFEGRRGIAAYQVWNEVNISTYWTGSQTQLARLTRAMDRVRKAVDPHALVVAPAMVTRLPFELHGIEKYYSHRLDGVPVWRHVDAVSLNLYPLPRYGHRTGVPEDAMAQLRQVRTILRRAGVPSSLPVWDTEINYGLRSGADTGEPAAAISDGAQAANVMRTYLLNAANGVARVFWYRYDMGPGATGHPLANTLLSVPDEPEQVTPAGSAYLRAQAWMHGTLLGARGRRPCARDAHGTYTCVVRDSSGTRRIYWNPFHHATVRLAGNAHHRESVLGTVSSVEPGARIRVGARPVMVGR
jgi:hypothetical protein